MTTMSNVTQIFLLTLKIMLRKKDTLQRKFYTLEHTVLTDLARSSTGEHKYMDMSVLDLYTSKFCILLCSPYVLQNNKFKLPVIHHTGIHPSTHPFCATALGEPWNPQQPASTVLCLSSSPSTALSSLLSDLLQCHPTI
jgi:hypothetical protein